MHKVAKLRSGWCNPSESYASYSWRLEEAPRVFVTSIVYAFLNWRVLDMASVGASSVMMVEYQRSYIKIETLRGKNPTEIHSALREVCGEQTVDRSTVCGEQTVDCSTVCGGQTVDRSTVFGEQTVNRSTVCGEQTVDRSTVSRWATSFREGRVTINDDQRPGWRKTNRWRECETCGGLSCTRSSSDVRGNITSCRDFTNISIAYFNKRLEKIKICARWVPHFLTAEQKQKRLEIATLLKQRYNVEGQAFLYRNIAIDERWVSDFEPELKSQSNEWKSLTSPRPKTSTSAVKGQANDDLCLWSPRNHYGRVPCGTSVTAVYYRDWMQKLRKKVHKNRPDLLGDGPLILHNARPHLGKVVNDLLSKYEWEVLPHAPYRPDMSPPDFGLFHKLKAHAWTPFSLPGRGFCSGYPSHPRTEQKWYPKWNSKSSQTLGRGH